MVEQSIARVIEVAPHDRDGDESRDEWREVDRPEQALEADELRAEEERGSKRHCDCERPADEREVESVPEREPEIGSSEELRVVRESYESRVAGIRDSVEVEIRNAEKKRCGDGKKEKDSDENESRREEEPGGGVCF